MWILTNSIINLCHNLLQDWKIGRLGIPTAVKTPRMIDQLIYWLPIFSVNTRVNHKNSNKCFCILLSRPRVVTVSVGIVIFRETYFCFCKVRLWELKIMYFNVRIILFVQTVQNVQVTFNLLKTLILFSLDDFKE